jgi:hypothetical protein
MVFHKISLFIFFITAHALTYASPTPCDTIPVQWKSQKAAIEYLRKSSFLIHEQRLAEGNDEAIRSASYYSCDGETGYLLIRYGGKEVLHQAVPLGVWQNLKNANSLSGYYHFYLRDRFVFKLKAQS